MTVRGFGVTRKNNRGWKRFFVTGAGQSSKARCCMCVCVCAYRKRAFGCIITPGMYYQSRVYASYRCAAKLADEILGSFFEIRRRGSIFQNSSSSSSTFYQELAVKIFLIHYEKKATMYQN